MTRWRCGGASDFYDQDVASSIPGQRAAVYDDSGQVVHARVPRRRQSSLLYGVVKLRTSIFGERTQVWSLDRLSPRARDAKPASLRHLRAHLRVFMT